MAMIPVSDDVYKRLFLLFVVADASRPWNTVSLGAGHLIIWSLG